MSKISTLPVLIIALVLFGARLVQAQDTPNAIPNESQFAPQSSVPSDPKVSVAVCPGASIPVLFGATGDAFIFNLIPFAKGKVNVWTADGGLFGPDIWRAGLYEIKPNGAGKSKSGDGSLGVFTGQISLAVKLGKTYQVSVSGDDVPAGLPAIMNVCISGPVFIVGPLPE